MAYGNRNLYPAIMRANPNLDPKKMRPGMTIVLPPVAEVRPDSSNADRTSSATPASHTAGSLDSRNEYRVTSGDTLERIAMKLYGKRDMIDKLYELNKEKIGPDRDKLRLGMVLKLPEPPTAATR
jgi:nucleoid-associated protein YgaU